MNFGMTDAKIQQHTNELRHQVSQCRGRVTNGSQHSRSNTRNRSHPSGLRNRLGITLIEAGLHLLATDGSQAHA
jgi:hypothetical protein